MSDFEQQIRQKLQAAGLLDRMKTLFLDAALDVVKNDADPSRTDPRLMKPSPLLLQNSDTESFSMSMALIVDFLRQYGLLHTLNCLKSECGSAIFPPEADNETEEEILEEREALCEDLGLSTEGSILERIYEKAMMKAAAPTTSQQHSIAEMPSKIQQQQQSNQQVAATPNKSVENSPVKGVSQSSSATSSPQKNEEASPQQQQQQKFNAPPEAKPYPITPVPSVTAAGKVKGAETPYTVEWFDGGEFVRYNKITGQPFVMEYMKNCRIIILDAIDNITMDDCENCEVIVAACENSAFIRTCKNVTLRIACKQLRTRDCADCDIFLFTNTDPVVEKSFGMNFYPFNIETPQLCQRFQSARFDAKMNRFIHVYDFTPDVVLGGGREHFTIHYPDHKNTKMMRYGMGVDEAAIESPPEIRMLLSGEIEPAQSLEKGASKALNIKTGAQTWQQQQQQQQQQTNNKQQQQEDEVQQSNRPQSAPVVVSSSAATALKSEQQTERPASAQPSTTTTSNSRSVVPPITGIAVGNSSNNNNNRGKSNGSATSSSDDEHDRTPPPQNRKPVVAAEQAKNQPSPKKQEKPEADAFMLKRDSSSSSSSSYTSYDEESDFEKGSDKEDDDDTF